MKLKREESIAQAVEVILLRDFGRDLGPRTRRNESPPGLRVDFTYDLASPPAALEVTSLDDEVQRRAADAASKAKERLRELIVRDKLGCWAVAFDSTSSLKTILPEIESLIVEWHARGPKPGDFIRPGVYSSDDLIRLGSDSKRREFKAEHVRLRALGLVELHYVGPQDDNVEFLAQGEMFLVVADVTSIAQAVEDNAAKLGESRDRKTHLAVDVLRPEMSADLSRSPAISLPSEVDMIWILFNWHRRPDRSRAVWSLTRDSDRWRAHDDPRRPT